MEARSPIRHEFVAAAGAALAFSALSVGCTASPYERIERDAERDRRDAAVFSADVLEAVDALIAEGRRTIEHWRASAELVHGNFLPRGAAELAEDPTLPSLGHRGQDGYAQLGLALDDFAIVYAYPWPGEDDFHESVFDQYAASGALLMLFCGPNDIRLRRKVEH